MKITRTDLIQMVETRLNLPAHRARQVVQAIFDGIGVALAAGDAVRLAGFGKFAPVTRPARSHTPPGAARPTERPAHTIVRFTPFARLKARVNTICLEDEDALLRYIPVSERRDTNRKNLPAVGTAIIRVSGIPVCEFKIKNISPGGSAILVEEDSVMLRNARIGQEIDIRITPGAAAQGPTLQRSKIVHITRSDDPELDGYYVIGLSLLGMLPVS